MPRRDTTLIRRARQLRRDRTDAENLLWYHLRRRNLAGHKFRFQHPLPPYIADLVCLEARLIVEVDGGQHSCRTDYDAARTEFLERQGFRIMRFWNNDVLQHTDAVLEAIMNALASRP